MPEARGAGARPPPLCRTRFPGRLEVRHKVAAAAVGPLLALLNHEHQPGGADGLGEGNLQATAAVAQRRLHRLVARLVAARRPALLQGHQVRCLGTAGHSPGRAQAHALICQAWQAAVWYPSQLLGEARQRSSPTCGGSSQSLTAQCSTACREMKPTRAGVRA